MKNLSKLLTSRFVVLSFNLAVALGFSTKAYGPVNPIEIRPLDNPFARVQSPSEMRRYWEFLCPGVSISLPPSPPSPPIPQGKCRAYDQWKMQNMIAPFSGYAAPPPSQPGQ